MKNMKNLYRVALLAALGLGSVTVAQAQNTDLTLGFNDAGGPSAAQNDYVIDLGITGNQLAAAGYSYSTTFSASTFNSAFSADGNALNDVAAGIVGGNTLVSPKQLYMTSSTAPNNYTSTSLFNNSVNPAEGVTLGEYQSSSTTSTANWSQIIAASSTAPGTEVSGTSLASESGNPMGVLSSGLLTLDLFENTETSGTHGTVAGWDEIGTVTINANNDTVTFAAVPEPATYGLLAAGGLLIIAVRRQLVSKNA